MQVHQNMFSCGHYYDTTLGLVKVWSACGVVILKFVHTAATPFNSENSFNMRDLFFLEEAGISVMSSLRNYIQHIEEELRIHVFPHDLDTLLNT